MSYARETGKVYYYVLEGSPYIFADERGKKQLLNIVSDIQREEGWLIYAFCVMDSRAYFVVEAEGAGGIKRGMQTAAQRFLGAADRLTQQAGRTLCASGAGRKLNTLAEIARCCRKIHRIPLEQGYVSRIGDYWWSSYPTYTGSYVWEHVDCRLLLMYFSADPDIARRKLKQFHRSDFCPSDNKNE